MSFLQGTSLLQGLGFNHSDDTLRSPTSENPLQSKLRPARSLGNLIQFARNPVKLAGEAFEDWYDGSTKEERVQRQAFADRKQLLYLKMRMV